MLGLTVPFKMEGIFIVHKTKKLIKKLNKIKNLIMN